MQRKDSSQATSTLGNTPNLNIGSQTNETLHWFIRPGLLYWFPDQNSQLLHPTGNSTLVLLTGKATLLPTLLFALHKQDSSSGSFKQQFPLNLHSVSVVHFALIDANWRISSFSRGFGLPGFCLPRIWIRVLRRSFELSGSIAPFLQASTFADRSTAMFDYSPRTKWDYFIYSKSNKNFLGWHFCRYQATPCGDIAFKLFTNLQIFHATTRLIFAFLTFHRCSLL